MNNFYYEAALKAIRKDFYSSILSSIFFLLASIFLTYVVIKKTKSKIAKISLSIVIGITLILFIFSSIGIKDTYLRLNALVQKQIQSKTCKIIDIKGNTLTCQNKEEFFIPNIVYNYPNYISVSLEHMLKTYTNKTINIWYIYTKSGNTLIGSNIVDKYAQGLSRLQYEKVENLPNILRNFNTSYSRLKFKTLMHIILEPIGIFIMLFSVIKDLSKRFKKQKIRNLQNLFKVRGHLTLKILIFVYAFIFPGILFILYRDLRNLITIYLAINNKRPIYKAQCKVYEIEYLSHYYYVPSGLDFSYITCDKNFVKFKQPALIYITNIKERANKTCKNNYIDVLFTKKGTEKIPFAINGDCLKP